MKPPANDTRQDYIKHKNRTQMKTEKEKDVFQKLAKYIVEKEMFRDHRLNRDVLRKLVKVSKNNFAPLFEKYAGMSFVNYVNGLRLKRAAEQLTNRPEMTIGEVATDCGVPKIQTFYRVFQKHFGMPPAQYRRIAMEERLREQTPTNE